MRVNPNGVTGTVKPADILECHSIPHELSQWIGILMAQVDN